MRLAALTVAGGLSWSATLSLPHGLDHACGAGDCVDRRRSVCDVTVLPLPLMLQVRILPAAAEEMQKARYSCPAHPDSRLSGKNVGSRWGRVESFNQVTKVGVVFPLVQQ